MNIVKRFHGFDVRFVKQDEINYGFGVIAEDMYAINAEFPDHGLLSPVEFYKYVSRAGDVNLCLWGRDTFWSLTQSEYEQQELLSLFELAMVATINESIVYRSEEYRVSSWLRRLPEFIPNAQILKWDEVKREKQIKTSLQPDFVLDVNGVIIPGEAKAVPFTQNHLKQLRSYMKLLRVNKGIALAPSLKCLVSQDIQFFTM